MTKFVLPSGFITALLLLPLFAPAARAAETIKVVASFSIIADLANQIGGERTEVTALVGPNTDMHVFQPSPIDAKRLRDARVVIINGFGFEGWAPRLAKASGFKGQLVVASKGVKLLRMEDSESHEHAGSGGHGKERSDPHAWQDIANAKIYAANIRDALIAADPDGRRQYERAASAYLAELDALDAEVRSAFAPIPKAARRVITSHDAFGYFGAAYGIEFLAPQGVGGDSEPTARDVAALIRQIKRERVRAVFVENISNPRVIEQIARETGIKPGGTLYSDALSDASGPATTYIDMMRHNARALAAAMQ